LEKCTFLVCGIFALQLNGTTMVCLDDDYLLRINRVLQHINNHLDEPLDLNSLAELSCCSPFHFHRIMRAYLGESLGVYVQRVRLAASAHLLRHSNMSIADIAYHIGYESPTSYNKAFKKRFGFTPSLFRANRNLEVPFPCLKQNVEIMNELDLQPRFAQQGDIKVIFASAMGPYHKSAQVAWDTICAYASKRGLMGPSSQFLSISHDDPTITEPEKCRYEACIAVSGDVKPEGKIGVKTIPAGKYAVFTVKGSYNNLLPSYGYIFGRWMQENKVEFSDEPAFEKYLNSPDVTPEEDLLTEIWVKLK